MVRGQVESYEGIITLHGGYAGWAPTSNPMIYLAEGGDYGSKNTLEIRKFVNGGWGWGDLACGTITSAGNLYLTGNTNGYLWNNGGYIRQSGGYGFVADGTMTSGSLAYSGTVAVYTNNNGTLIKNPSSIRYKQNIETLSDCSWLYNLRPVNFDWKDEEREQVEGKQIGLIAEEVYAQCPQLTWFDRDGKPEGVHYERLGIPLLVEVKKLHQRVEALENQLKNTSAA